ncbi:uncharacterized protein LOC127850344 [Dreissena polymorpha]|uniref:Uncharacterized protein n=1 Tax=Dreissena polymorpha TaxID=45954 RepID=A0A9D4D5D4_DREPO|nr:uncharacterized protein LOC127850344 [Dreissena polymorpha]KAH3739348.1 hypothetical protein DPMN_046000 [Dreissena polymorpha]
MNEYINNAAENPTGNVTVLLDLIEKCESRVMYIDNEMENEKIQVMIDDIISTIDANTVRIGQDYFTNQMFQEAMKYADQVLANVDISKIKRQLSGSSNTIEETKNMNIPEPADTTETAIKASTDENEQNVRRLRQKFESNAAETGMLSRERLNTETWKSTGDLRKRFSTASFEEVGKAIEAKDEPQPNNDHRMSVETSSRDDESLKKENSSENETTPRSRRSFHQSLNMKLQDGWQRANRDKEVVNSSDFEQYDAEPLEVPGRKYDQFKDDLQANNKSFDRAFNAIENWFDRRIKELSNFF